MTTDFIATGTWIQSYDKTDRSWDPILGTHNNITLNSSSITLDELMSLLDSNSPSIDLVWNGDATYDGDKRRGDYEIFLTNP